MPQHFHPRSPCDARVTVEAISGLFHIGSVAATWGYWTRNLQRILLTRTGDLGGIRTLVRVILCWQEEQSWAAIFGHYSAWAEGLAGHGPTCRELAILRLGQEVVPPCA